MGATPNPRTTFRTTIRQSGNNTGIEVPAEVVDLLGGSRRPPVRVTVNGHTYRSTVAARAGVFLLSLSAANRAAAGAAGGDVVDVEIELDTAPREVTVPDDFADALQSDPHAASAFESLSYSRKLAHVLSVDGAKTQETRHRRIEKALAGLRAG